MPRLFGSARPIKRSLLNVALNLGGMTYQENILGVPQERVDELVRERTKPLEALAVSQRETIELLKEKLGLREVQIRAALDIVGERDIQPEQRPAKLIEIAKGFKALEAMTFRAAHQDSPKITALQAEAKRAIDAGELSKADAALAEVQAEKRLARERWEVSEAETLAGRGEIAMTRLRYNEAATHFANAAAMLLPDGTHKDRRISYLQEEAEALHLQGEEFGDNRALRLAIERWRHLVLLHPRERVPPCSNHFLEALLV